MSNNPKAYEPVNLARQGAGTRRSLRSQASGSPPRDGQISGEFSKPTTRAAPKMRSFANRNSIPTSLGATTRGFWEHRGRDDDVDSDRSRDSSQRPGGERLGRILSTPEPNFLENSLQSLDRSNPLQERVDATIAISREIPFYTLHTAMRIIEAASDLASPSSELTARRAAFRLLEATAQHADISHEDKLRIYSLCSPAVDGSEVSSQLRCLRTLTGDGRYLEPFTRDVIDSSIDLIPKQYVDAAHARKKNKGSSTRSSTVLQEEKGLFILLDLVANYLRANAESFTEQNLDQLIQETIAIAEKTISKKDMERAVGIFAATIEYAHIPAAHIRQCIEVLCAILEGVPDLKAATRECLLKLLKTSDRETVIEILLDTLGLAPNSRHSRTVGGALIILCEIALTEEGFDLPFVPFGQLIEALRDVHFGNRSTRRDCLKAIQGLLKEEQLKRRILESDWEILIKVILTATGDENYIHDKTSEPLTIRAYLGSKTQQIPVDESTVERNLADEITELLNDITKSLSLLWDELSPEQRQLVSLLYFKLRLVLPPATLGSLIQQLSANGHFKPGQNSWQNHQLELLRLFVWDRDMDPDNCCLIIHVLSDSLAYAETKDLEHFHMIVLRLLNDLQEQMILDIANDLAAFAASTWRKWRPAQIDSVLERFWPLMSIKDMTSETEPQLWGTEVKINEVSLSFVGLFLDYLVAYPEQTKGLYEYLIEIAKAHDLPAVVRLPALRLLIRLRCDALGRIFISEVSDSLGLADTLLRTEATAGSMAKFSVDRPIDETPPPSRQSRASAKLTSRGSLGYERTSRPLPTPPLWMYPGGPGLPKIPPNYPSPVLSVHSSAQEGLKLSEWLIVVIDILQQGGHWEVYSYVLVHLPSQLSHPSLFSGATPHIKMLRNVIVSQLQNGKFQDPPPNTGVNKGDVALCLYHSLTMLLGYSDLFARAEQDDIVRTFLTGIGGWERTGKACIQSLAICCHSIPGAVTRALTAIVQKMSQIITQSNLAIDILEFLGGLARLPEVYINFREDEFRTVFAVCVKYLEHAREQRQKLLTTTSGEADYNSNRLSGVSSKSSSTSSSAHNVDVHRDLPQYVFALAYHVITIWFMSLKLMDRSSHVGWITANLAWKDPQGNEYMEEQSQVTLDMMHRVAYLDLGETHPGADFKPSDGHVMKKSWLLGLSIVTIETAVGTGLTQIVKRQASGTTYASYQQHTRPLPPHHIPVSSDASSSMHGPESRINIFPNHIFLQLSSTIAPTPTPLEPICLPDDDMIKRAITAFDRNDTVDGYKVGVIYVGNGQTEESKILANTEGSRAFELFLARLGTKIELKGAPFNTQGLDREMDLDGSVTYAWRDRVAEIVFHVPTMMPTDLEHDSACINKKRHIGNDFVNIIFNESGQPFKFDTFPSQFNCVNIVVTPEDRPATLDKEAEERLAAAEKSDEDIMKGMYIIQTMSHPNLPHISPTASYKLLPLANLPNLTHQLALQCSVFSNVWTQRAGGEVISSWRNRLREIHKLRERYANTGTSTSAKFPGAKQAKTYAPGDSFRGRVEMGGLAEEEGVLGSLDFSRWAGPPPPLS